MDPIDLNDIVPLGGAGPVRQEEGIYSQPKEEKDDEKERHSIINGQAAIEYKNHKKLLESKNWKPIPYNGVFGITCYEYEGLEVPGVAGMVYAFKASGVVDNKSADEIARAHMNSDHPSRIIWDKDLSDIGQLEVRLFVCLCFGLELYINASLVCVDCK